jgi:hypothetical protein
MCRKMRCKMAKVINVNGFTMEPGLLTYNGKRYQFMTVGQDKKTVQDYVKTLPPDKQKSIVIANEDLTHYSVYGRKNPKVPRLNMIEVKTPVKLARLNPFRFRYGGHEYKKTYGDGLTSFARSPAEAKGNIMHYYGDLLPKDRHGRLEPYNEFLIVKVLDNQFSVFCPLK